VRAGRTLCALGIAAALALVAGCGSDKSGETTVPQVSVPELTSPIPTTTTAQPATTKRETAPTTTSAGGTAACTIPDTYQHFTYSGLDCASALAVARAWDADGKDCNTVDNPNVQAGYQRTCTVNGYSCTAKRDVHSDGRFVTCTQGGQTVRFTWLPA